MSKSEDWKTRRGMLGPRNAPDPASPKRVRRTKITDHCGMCAEPIEWYTRNPPHIHALARFVLCCECTAKAFHARAYRLLH